MITSTSGSHWASAADCKRHIGVLQGILIKRGQLPPKRPVVRLPPKGMFRPLRGDPETIAVSLCGKRSGGVEMLVDRAVWAALQPRFGTRYVVRLHKGAQGWCVCPAEMKGAYSLPHHITGAGPGDVVRHRNGNTMDLRMGNLEIVAGED